jgi:hypothetical protein
MQKNKGLNKGYLRGYKEWIKRYKIFEDKNAGSSKQSK